MTKTTFVHKTYSGENNVLTPVPKKDLWGFYGSMKCMVGEKMAIKLWDSASLMISTNFHEDNPAVVRNFLRSPYGRHLADRVAFFAKEEDYGDDAAMYEAVLSTITEVGRSGNLFWKKQFDKIKVATATGEWED